MSKYEDKAEKLEKITEKLWKDDYIYIKKVSRYFWVNKRTFYRPSDAASNLLCSWQDLRDLRINGIIKDYDDICYKQGWKANCFNLLDENSILKPSNTPELDNDIQELIENLCWRKEKNIEWMYKAILYKYTHLNDFTIPAVVFFGRGGSWKWTFMSLLWTIFWEENMMSNLGQRELTSQFDTYKWEKLIIEFAEVVSNNTHADKLILNKLKNIVAAEKITVNIKWVQAYQIDNIVWTFISSNSNLPLLLDDRDKGNRRFTLIRSNTSLKNGEQINKSIRDINKVSNFLAWLYKKYPEVVHYKDFKALDNQEKEELEYMSQSNSSLFWDWYEEKYSHKTGKILKTEIDQLIDNYTALNEVLDPQWFKRFFWKTSKYPVTRLRFKEFNSELRYCVVIPEKSEQLEQNNTE